MRMATGDANVAATTEGVGVGVEEGEGLMRGSAEGCSVPRIRSAGLK